MKRLFQVITPKGKHYNPSDAFKHLYTSGVMTAEGYFEGKKHAKYMRDILNETLPVSNNKKYHVSYAPDHRLYNIAKHPKTHFGSKGHRQGQGPGTGYKNR